jgi:hypothetical protein
MYDSHPAEKLDRICDCRGYDAPRTGWTVPHTFNQKSGRFAQGMRADAACAMLPSRRLPKLSAITFFVAAAISGIVLRARTILS